ncbi:hypothetical protein KJZ99_00110 [bacterium]|nr:hypothetical protein [bacterium]
MSFEIIIDRSSVRRARVELRRRVVRANGSARQVLRRRFVEVRQAASDIAPVARGVFRRSLTVESRSLGSGEFEIAVGTRRTGNQHEVDIEQGGHINEPHRDMERHVHGPFGCGSGRDGGWGDDTEPVNYAMMFSLGVNPRAGWQPLGKALRQVLGNVVDGSSASRFMKGRKNVYRSSQGLVSSGGGKLFQEIYSMLRKMVTVIVLGILLTGAVSAQTYKETPRTIFAADTSLSAGNWIRSLPQPIVTGNSVLGLFDLHLWVSVSAPESLVCYAEVGFDTSAMGVQRLATGDTLWVISPEATLNDSGYTQWEIPVRSGHWYRLCFQERGTSTAKLNATKTKVVRK